MGSTSPHATAQAEARAFPPSTFIFVVPDGADHLVDGGLHFVGISGGKVGEDAATVDPLPQEGVVREFVDEGPAQLLRDEPLHFRRPHDLRQLRRVAESI